ncbi:unnamed protein product [Linum trigynum]|uniref:Uncharacterized protein n=1 Tax=Linum trigynum TaxID=586398 RepID=A0AAV2FXC3_9ROSI
MTVSGEVSHDDKPKGEGALKAVTTEDDASLEINVAVSNDDEVKSRLKKMAGSGSPFNHWEYHWLPKKEAAPEMEKTTDATGFGERLKMISAVASGVVMKGEMMDSCGPSCQLRISSSPKDRSTEIEMKGPWEPCFERLEQHVAAAPPGRGPTAETG